MRHLDLAQCPGMRNEQLAAIAELQQLRSLRLKGHTRLTDAGLRAVGRLRGLASLDVSGCSKVSACLPALPTWNMR